MKPELYQVKLASEAWEIAQAARLRHAVFCLEQAIFSQTDQDPIDACAISLVALYAGEVVGTVRIHQEQPGVWFGSRLAVQAEHRRSAGVGPSLIRLAVGTAHALGAHAFFAHVQNPNVPLFQRMHWTSISEELHHGHPHHLMQADLAHYPPIQKSAAA